MYSGALATCTGTVCQCTPCAAQILHLIHLPLAACSGHCSGHCRAMTGCGSLQPATCTGGSLQVYVLGCCSSWSVGWIAGIYHWQLAVLYLIINPAGCLATYMLGTPLCHLNNVATAVIGCSDTVSRPGTGSMDWSIPRQRLCTALCEKRQ